MERTNEINEHHFWHSLIWT